MNITFRPEEMARLATPVPRYTSYPTAPHFTQEINNLSYRSWLQSIPSGARISLYLHIPFCDTLCWFCGCHTRMVRKYAPITTYLGHLMQEIKEVGASLSKDVVVTHIHWGGGSPSMLAPEDVTRLEAATRAAFNLAPICDFSVEIDPRGMDDARLDALSHAGLTRASIGVQDFDASVQKAINRFQSFEETQKIVQALRLRGIKSLNVDMLYGLPHQNAQAVEASLQQVITLQPDRIALFGYAHVPWMKKHQEMIDESTLPSMRERLISAEGAAALLQQAGYQRIGIDHFARPEDALAQAFAQKRLRRNFQGYTTDDSDCLIGLGASSIGEFSQGFIQNEAGGQVYNRRIEEEGLAVARGLQLSAEDHLRAALIESLMCYLNVDFEALEQQFGVDVSHLRVLSATLFTSEEAPYLTQTPQGFVVKEEGRPFLRLIAAHFDAYLPRGAGRHSSAM